MTSVNKLLEYHELLMNYEDTSNYEQYNLPTGYHFDFYKNDKDIVDWVNIHFKAGEFIDYEDEIAVFHDYYDHFEKELNKRCIFILNEENEKIGTGTISLLKEEEYGYDAVVDWVAIKKEYQGKHLSRPLISRLIKLANELGHKKILLHTQTHSWLAAKLYLDAGFNPFNIEKDYKGWQILKTLINHPKLSTINKIDESQMYFNDAILIYKELVKNYGENFEYTIWHKNGRHNVDVLYKGLLYKFSYELDGNKAILTPIIKENKYVRVMFGNKSGANSSLEFKIDNVTIANFWDSTKDDPKKMGGFNFSTEEKILRWLVRGDTIYDVEIPEDAEVVDCVNIAAPHGVFRSNKIILKNPRIITDDMAMDFYLKSKLPEKSYLSSIFGLAVRGHLNTAKRIINDKVNSSNINVAIDEYLDFIKPTPGWDKEIDLQFSKNAKLIYDLLLEKKKEYGME